jgi:hypothetical protein
MKHPCITKTHCRSSRSGYRALQREQHVDHAGLIMSSSQLLRTSHKGYGVHSIGEDEIIMTSWYRVCVPRTHTGDNNDLYHEVMIISALQLLRTSHKGYDVHSIGDDEIIMTSWYRSCVPRTQRTCSSTGSLTTVNHHVDHAGLITTSTKSNSPQAGSSTFQFLQHVRHAVSQD